MRFTVLGGAGFIGRRLVAYLRARGHDVLTPPRDAENLHGDALGHVIYAIGLTGNFRQAPGAAIEAHVNVLRRLMDGADFDSWLYLSSTRVYGSLPAGEVGTEDIAIPVKPGADSLYDLSKLLGEAICLGKDSKKVRVARLSNVYGSGQSHHTFLGSIVRDLARQGKVSIGEAPSSAKDYIAVDDVVATLEQIATKGRERLYNVASGRLVSHEALSAILGTCGYDVKCARNGPERIFPLVDISRIQKEFGRRMRSVTDDLPTLVEQEKG